MLQTLSKLSIYKLITYPLNENKLLQLLQDLNHNPTIARNISLLCSIPGLIEYNCLQNSNLNTIQKYIEEVNYLSFPSYYALLKTFYSLRTNLKPPHSFFTYCYKINQKFINYVNLNNKNIVKDYYSILNIIFEPLFREVLKTINTYISQQNAIECFHSFIKLHLSLLENNILMLSNDTILLLFKIFIRHFNKFENYIQEDIKENFFVTTLNLNHFFLNDKTLIKSKIFLYLLAKYLPSWYYYINITRLSSLKKKFINFIDLIKQIQTNFNPTSVEYKFLLYLADKYPITDIDLFQLDLFVKLIPYIPDKKALDLYNALSSLPTQSILLNHKIFQQKKHKEKLITMLKKYLKSSDSGRKLENHKVVITKEIIDQLTDYQLLILIERSYTTDLIYNNQTTQSENLVPIRFKYTPKALKEIDKRMFALLFNQNTPLLVQTYIRFKKAHKN